MSPDAVLAIERIIDRMQAIIEKEDNELAAIGVGWPSAHSEIYRLAKQVLKDIDQTVGELDAIKKGIVSKDDK